MLLRWNSHSVKLTIWVNGLVTFSPVRSRCCTAAALRWPHLTSCPSAGSGQPQVSSISLHLHLKRPPLRQAFSKDPQRNPCVLPWPPTLTGSSWLNISLYEPLRLTYMSVMLSRMWAPWSKCLILFYFSLFSMPIPAWHIVSPTDYLSDE